MGQTINRRRAGDSSSEYAWYGVRWSEDNGQIQRIASDMALHASLPIQSGMKRCMLTNNGTVYKYISDSNPLEYEDGTTANYDGTDGQVMVEIPAYSFTAYKEVDENNITWNYLKLYPNGGGETLSRKIYRGAFEMICDNSNNNTAVGCSVSMIDLAGMNVTKDTVSFAAADMQYLNDAATYRNWNYNNVDATSVKNSLGKPTTNRNRDTFRAISARRGAGFSQEYWEAWNSLIRLFMVEYCTLNTQDAINDTLTNEGFKQGGLGPGVSTCTINEWSSFNAYNPFVPCGVTIPLGSKSGAIDYIFATGEFRNAAITFSVPSYRGIENPFGHIWTFIDGFNTRSVIQRANYICNDVSKFAENNAAGYELESISDSRTSGNIGGIEWNSAGTFWPKPGGRAVYNDYFWSAFGTGDWYTLFSGGDAYRGAGGGFFCLYADSGAGRAIADVGARLLYTSD